ncbi:MAG: hypothetical protein ACI86C_001345 [Candidatus Latescibacterota bacterium]|jgi:hypothetical protein
MKWICIFTFLISSSLFSQELIAIASFPLAASSFIGVDGYGNTYAIDNGVLHKTGPVQDFGFTDFSLGPISTVDIINPLKIVVFYESTNTVVFLDNKLNEIERLLLTNNPELANISAATNAGNNRLWLFNTNTQQLELFNFRTTTSTTISQPFPGKFIAMASNFNYCYILTEKSLRSFNRYGSLLAEIPSEGFKHVFLSDDTCVALNKSGLYFLNKGAFNLLKLPPSKNSIKDLYLSQEFLYIYDGKSIHTFSLTQPKK